MYIFIASCCLWLECKLLILQALTSTKTDWNLTWVHHPDTITQVKYLVKYIMLD